MHNWLKDLINACTRKIGSEDCVIFIDCNPSFSTYTELSMIASDRLMIPCSSDGSSARAISNVAALLYGHNIPNEYSSVDFFSKSKEFRMPLPLVHSVVLNRSTQYSEKTSKAFAAMFDAIKEKVLSLRKNKPEHFVGGEIKFLDMPDSHSVAIVCSHHGMPLYQVHHGRYKVHDTNPQVNRGPLDRYKEAVSNLIKTI